METRWVGIQTRGKRATGCDNFDSQFVLHLGTCTCTVNLLRNSGYVPEETRAPNLPMTDVANWVDLAPQAGNVVGGCVRRGWAGWTLAGMPGKKTSVLWSLPLKKQHTDGVLLDLQARMVVLVSSSGLRTRPRTHR